MTRNAWLIDLGRRDYAEVWQFQKQLVDERIRDAIPDALVLVEHPPVVTLGRHRQPSAFTSSPSERDVPVYEIERGGQATYHGPGQLVGYPILKLTDERRDLHRYLRDLEAVLMNALSAFGISTQRSEGATGVWTSDDPSRKLASIGIAVRRWVTYHGFALNVATDLDDFRIISPCGFNSEIMTSMTQELDRPVSLDQVKPSVCAAFEAQYGVDLHPREMTASDVSAVQHGVVSRD